MRPFQHIPCDHSWMEFSSDNQATFQQNHAFKSHLDEEGRYAEHHLSQSSGLRAQLRKSMLTCVQTQLVCYIF